MINVSRSSRKKVPDELFAVHLTVGSQSIIQALSLHSKALSQAGLRLDWKITFQDSAGAWEWNGLIFNKKKINWTLAPVLFLDTDLIAFISISTQNKKKERKKRKAYNLRKAKVSEDLWVIYANKNNIAIKFDISGIGCLTTRWLGPP